MAAQLASTQEREAQARQDAEEAHGMFEDLSARSKLDGEEIVRLQKERDELLQRNAAANEKADEVLKELEMERDLRWKAKSRPWPSSRRWTRTSRWSALFGRSSVMR